MSTTIVRTDQAIADLKQLSEFIARDSQKSAERFLHAVEVALQFLAGMPEFAGRCEFRSPDLQDLRVWPIRKFKNHLIFYRPIENGIEVVRVLHGARDLDALFE